MSTQRRNSLMLNQQDFAALERNCFPKKWSSVNSQDRCHIRSLVTKLDSMADSVAASYLGRAGMVPFHTTFQLGGTVTKRLTVGCCPQLAPHREYSIFQSCVVSSRGIWLALRIGSGSPLRASSLSSVRCTEFLETSQVRLQALPRKIISAIEARLEFDHIEFASNLASEDEKLERREFPDLKSWLVYASSPIGKGSTISMFLEPKELSFPVNVESLFSEYCGVFLDLFEFVYCGDI